MSEHDDLETRLLWAHLVSRHAVILDIDCTREELEQIHRHDHLAPGGIRNHTKEDRSYSLRKMGQVLSENES